MATDADRHLLFGLLALQNGIINQVQLVAAFQAWTLDKSRSLADRLEARGDLNPARRALLEALAQVQLDVHGGNVEKSLAAVSAGKPAQESLARIGRPEVEATLTRVGSGSTERDVDDDRTTTLSIGTATSDGQRFRVLRPHALGGLGAVFVALDGELNREVALKQILDHHADDPVSRQRFLLEAEITGGLEHPGIVPVYGLGTYDGGRPYYAMRFIRGDSLKEAIERFHQPGRSVADSGARSLELRKLLRRFTDVCNAIEYAHSRGVLHRDIKPGNIIVGKHGETLVVDWGLAKPMGKAEAWADGGERALMPSSASGSAETLPGSALGTPPYMSPEQSAGDLDRLGPRSDVYSLGATLYCLLTGKAPFDGDVFDVLRRVQNGDFPRLRQLDPAIDPALEAICLRAMARRPDDRYAGPKALAEDLERWMADEPVSAWREPYARRVRRWAKRNRTAVTAAAVALIAGVVGLSAVLAVQTRANIALATANAELTRSRTAVQDRYDLAVEAIKTFHTGVSEDVLLKEDKFRALRVRLLNSASNFYGRLAALLGKETGLASRLALAKAESEVADLTYQIGRREDALAMHRAVLSRRRALTAEPEAGPEAGVDLGRSLVQIGFELVYMGRNVEAEPVFREAEALLSRLAGSSPPAPGARAVLADCRSQFSLVFYHTDRAAEALEMCDRARIDQEAEAAAPGATAKEWHVLGDNLIRLGNAQKMLGKLSEAEATNRRGIEILTRAADADPSASWYRNDLACTHMNLAILLNETGRPLESQSQYRAALAIWERLVKENPAVSSFRLFLPQCRQGLGMLLADVGKAAEAEALFRESLATCRRLAEENPDDVSYRSSLAMAHWRFGEHLSKAGKPQEAEAEFRRSISIGQELAGKDPADTNATLIIAYSRVYRGPLLMETGKPSEAEAQCRSGSAMLQKLAAENPSLGTLPGFLATGRDRLGELLSREGELSEAEGELRGAVALWEKSVAQSPVSETRLELANSLRKLGALLSAAGRPREAVAEHRKALALMKRLAGENPTKTGFRSGMADAHADLGRALARAGKPAEAEGEFREAIEVRRRLADANPAFVEPRSGLAAVHVDLGALLSAGDRPVEAAAEHRKALALYQELADATPDDPAYRDGLARALDHLGEAARAVGVAAEARELLDRSVAHRERLIRERPGVTKYAGHLAESLRRRGLVRRVLGDLAGASADLRRALAVYDALPTRTGEDTFQFACAHAALAGLAGRPGSSVSAAEGTSESETAMALLRKAVGMSYRSPDAYRAEDSLDPLRDREDFRLLIADLTMPTDPFATPR